MNLPYQEKLISILRNQLTDKISLSNEISRILEVSVDSACRRVRCETSMLLDEVAVVGKALNVPIESVFLNKGNVVSFMCKSIGGDESDFRIIWSTFMLISIQSGSPKRKKFFMQQRIFLFFMSMGFLL